MYVLVRKRVYLYIWKYNYVLLFAPLRYVLYYTYNYNNMCFVHVHACDEMYM